MSFPGAFPVISVRRRASAPYWSMISSGSIPFPKKIYSSFFPENHAPDHGSVHDGTAFSGLLDRRKYHTDHPEENDVISGYQYIGRIEVIKNLRSYPASQGGERPQCGREPGIQCIFILFKVCASAFRADLRHFFCNDHFAALVTVICRDTMSPPELSGNTPVTDVLQPVQIDLVKTIRYKNSAPFFFRASIAGFAISASLQTTAV